MGLWERKVPSPPLERQARKLQQWLQRRSWFRWPISCQEPPAFESPQVPKIAEAFQVYMHRHAVTSPNSSLLDPILNATSKCHRLCLQNKPWIQPLLPAPSRQNPRLLPVSRAPYMPFWPFRSPHFSYPEPSTLPCPQHLACSKPSAKMCVFMSSCACLVIQLCPTLFYPMDCSPPGCSTHWIFQARVLEWVAISFSRRSSQPRDQTHVSRVSCTGQQILYHWATWEAPVMLLINGNIEHQVK